MADPILTKLAKSRARLLALVQDLPDEALENGPAGGWTIRQTLTHLLNAEEDHCRIIAVVAKGEAHRLPDQIDIDAHNAAGLESRGHLSRAELLDALVAQRQRTEALFARLSSDQLALIAPHPALGQMPLRDIFRVLGVHEQQHARDLEAYLRA